jgi:hypothetical protein
MTLYWIDPTTRERDFISPIVYGNKQTVWLDSEIGSEFELLDDVTNDTVASYIIQHHSFFVVGEPTFRTYELEDLDASAADMFVDEWSTSHKVKRTFTELGFALGKLPLDLFASMSTYYYNNRHSNMREEWETLGGILVNWWEQNVFVVSMPWGLKRYWQSRLKDLVQAWSGVELELTDIYGMRRYEDGAQLLTHVDWSATHAASLIINVAQGGIREPWAVEIYDHADRLHEITMEEGDIVYYESARCLHGRMKPLAGEFYVNLFAHYRPVGDPEWYLKPNPEGSVQPLLDISDCTATATANGTTTTCSSGAHLPFLSPSREQLTGPSDLFQHWKKVSPAPTGTPATAPAVVTATAAAKDTAADSSEEL